MAASSRASFEILGSFDSTVALCCIGQYLNLDKDHNGMLSKAELLHYGTSTLTPAFVNRVFEVCLTYGGEMDYKTYLDFVLALENRKEPQVRSQMSCKR